MDNLVDIADLAKDPISKKQKYQLDTLFSNMPTSLRPISTDEMTNQMHKKHGSNFNLTFEKSPKDLQRTCNLTTKEDIDHTEMINMLCPSPTAHPSPPSPTY
eukprot:9475617-Ditylum_brightwellii.AAC.1